jgi:hypothetical protein
VPDDARIDELVADGGRAVSVLRRRLAEERSARRLEERRAREAVSLRLAVIRTARERDALTSDALDAQQRRVDDLAARIAAAVVSTDTIRDRVNQLASHGVDVLDDPLVGGSGRLAAALTAEATVRAALSTRLAAAGLDPRLHLPPAAPLAGVPAEARRGIDDLLIEAHEEHLERDAARQRSGRGHEARLAASQHRNGRYGPR